MRQVLPRHAQRHDTARAERIAAREAICAELEAIGAAPEGSDQPADLLAMARAFRSRWQQEIASRGVDPERARTLDQRFALAFGTVINRWPAVFGGSDMDPESNRKRMETLVGKVEALAASLSGAAGRPSARVADHQARCDAEGGACGQHHRRESRRRQPLRAAQEELRQVQAQLSRIGMVPEDARRSAGRPVPARRPEDQRSHESAARTAVARLTFTAESPAASDPSAAHRESSRTGSSPRE